MTDEPDEPPMLDDEDQAAIAESEAQIARGEALDWKIVSAELRRRYLSEPSNEAATESSAGS